jgi:hypothetical protein
LVSSDDESFKIKMISDTNIVKVDKKFCKQTILYSYRATAEGIFVVYLKMKNNKKEIEIEEREIVVKAVSKKIIKEEFGFWIPVISGIIAAIGAILGIIKIIYELTKGKVKK